MLRPATAFVLFLSILLTGSAPAEGVRIELEPVGAAREAWTGEVIARPVSSPALTPVTTRVEVPGGVELELGAGAGWEVSARIPGGWAAPLRIGPDAAAGLTMEIWRTATVTGRLSTPAPHAPPVVLQVRFESSPGVTGPLIQRAVSDCPVQSDSRFACELPASTLDLRLHADSFISVYRWEKRLRPDQTKHLGEIALLPGAAVAGWVAVAEGHELPASGSANLTPAVSAPQPQDKRLFDGTLDLSAPIDSRGFFHILDVPAGVYTLAVQAESFAPARVFPVKVFAGIDFELDRPLVLARPLTLELFVEPATDHYGKPWSIELAKLARLPFDEIPQGQIEVALDGALSWPGLGPGRYRIEIRSSRRAIWHYETVVLSTTSPAVMVEIASVPIEGTIHLAEEPLKARAHFRSRGRLEGFTSDEDGAFTGVLPGEGTWFVDLFANEPQIRRRDFAIEVERGDADVAIVEIRLPDTRLDGRVVDQHGAPVASASLVVMNHNSDEKPFGAGVGPAGEFSLVGLPVGTYRLRASGTNPSGRDLLSPSIEVRLEENLEPPPVVLTLYETTPLRGEVVSASGPVTGAYVLVVPAQAPTTPMPGLSTDVQGRFETTELPAGTKEILLSIQAPGYALHTQRRPHSGKERVTIRLRKDGGTLRLDLPPGGLTPSLFGVQPWLLHNGSILRVSSLAGWATLNEVTFRQRGSLVVPRLEAGTYAACMLDLSDALRALQSGSVPADTCVSGDVIDFGTETLVLPTLGEKQGLME